MIAETVALAFWLPFKSLCVPYSVKVKELETKKLAEDPYMKYIIIEWLTKSLDTAVVMQAYGPLTSIPQNIRRTKKKDETITQKLIKLTDKFCISWITNSMKQI